MARVKTLTLKANLREKEVKPGQDHPMSPTHHTAYMRVEEEMNAGRCQTIWQ